MTKHIKFTGPGKAKVYSDEEKPSFWIEHLLPLLCTGAGLVIVVCIVLALSDTGRGILTWTGLVIGVLSTLLMLIAPVRAMRMHASSKTVIGGLLVALGWGTQLTVMLGGGAYALWVGEENISPLLGFMLHGGLAICTAVAGAGIFMMTRGPLPALDRTSRSARVLYNRDDSEGDQTISVEYVGADGELHEASLADLIDDHSREQFTLDSVWQIYAFQDLDFADAVVLLTEQHDEVWRCGYKLNGVRLGGESGPVRPAGPGSPFLREGGKFKFADALPSDG